MYTDLLPYSMAVPMPNAPCAVACRLLLDCTVIAGLTVAISHAFINYPGNWLTNAVCQNLISHISYPDTRSGVLLYTQYILTVMMIATVSTKTCWAFTLTEFNVLYKVHTHRLRGGGLPVLKCFMHTLWENCVACLEECIGSKLWAQSYTCSCTTAV